MKKTLEEVYLEHGIKIRDEHGFLRNVIDLLEDMYLKLTHEEFRQINEEIFFQEKMAYIFEDSRKKGNI